MHTSSTLSIHAPILNLIQRSTTYSFHSFQQVQCTFSFISISTAYFSATFTIGKQDTSSTLSILLPRGLVVSSHSTQGNVPHRAIQEHAGYLTVYTRDNTGASQDYSKPYSPTDKHSVHLNEITRATGNFCAHYQHL
jgi:hypothetical protein